MFRDEAPTELQLRGLDVRVAPEEVLGARPALAKAETDRFRPSLLDAEVL